MHLLSAMRFVAGSGALFLGSVVMAAVPLPSLPPDLFKNLPQAHSHGPPAPGATLGHLPIRFEKTTLAQVAAAVGRGTVAQQGDAAESLSWLCYTVAHRYRVWLSSSEMGGGEYIDGLLVQASATVQPEPACPTLPIAFQPVALTNGLRLGMALPRLTRILGPASQVAGAWRSYDYQAKVPPIEKCPPSGHDFDNNMVVKLHAGRISLLSATQTSSC